MSNDTNNQSTLSCKTLNFFIPGRIPHDTKVFLNIYKFKFYLATVNETK